MLLNNVHHCWNNADILSHQDNSLLLQPCIWLLHPSLAFLLLNLFEGEHVNSRVKLLKEAVSFYFKQVICFKLYCLPVLSILSIRIYHKFYMLTILCVWCPVEPCARWVNPRGLRVPAIAGRVRVVLSADAGRAQVEKFFVRITGCWTKAHELNQLKNRKTRGCTKVVSQHYA